MPLREHNRIFFISTVKCFDRVQQESSFPACTTHSTALFTPLRAIRCWKPYKRPSQRPWTLNRKKKHIGDIAQGLRICPYQEPTAQARGRRPPTAGSAAGAVATPPAAVAAPPPRRARVSRAWHAARGRAKERKIGHAAWQAAHGRSVHGEGSYRLKDAALPRSKIQKLKRAQAQRTTSARATSERWPEGMYNNSISYESNDANDPLQERHFALQTQRIPALLARRNPHSFRSAATVGCGHVASHAGRRRRHPPHRLGPSSRPATPPPSSRRRGRADGNRK